MKLTSLSSAVGDVTVEFFFKIEAGRSLSVAVVFEVPAVLFSFFIRSISSSDC